MLILLLNFYMFLLIPKHRVRALQRGAASAGSAAADFDIAAPQPAARSTHTDHVSQARSRGARAHSEKCARSTKTQRGERTYWCCFSRRQKFCRFERTYPCCFCRR